MLTLMAMRWNQQKFNYLATSLARRYQKVDESLFFSYIVDAFYCIFV